MSKVAIPEFPDIAPTDDWGSVLDCINKYAEAYAAAKVREALEEAAKEPRAYAMSLDSQGWGNRFPDELTAIFNASTNMAGRIRALIPRQ